MLGGQILSLRPLKTAFELAFVTLCEHGATDRQISAELNISEGGVRKMREIHGISPVNPAPGVFCIVVNNGERPPFNPDICEDRFVDNHEMPNCNYHDSSIGECTPELCPRLKE